VASQRDLQRAVQDFPLETRRALLRVLTADPEYRAAAIGRLHVDAPDGEMVELLIDLEEEPVIRADVIGALRDSLKERRGPMWLRSGRLGPPSG
jgi:hypothetical protein